MTHCKTCQYWNADPNDNGMGRCNGMESSPLVEFTFDLVDAFEIYTKSTFGCEIGIDKPRPDVSS